MEQKLTRRGFMAAAGLAGASLATLAACSSPQTSGTSSSGASSADDPHPENRGKDEWERITWDEAGDMIAEKWKQVEKDFGPLANTYYQGCGSQGSLNGNAGLTMRLYRATGCTYWHYSFDAATNTGLTRGGIQWFDQSEPQDFVNSDYILINRKGHGSHRHFRGRLQLPLRRPAARAQGHPLHTS